MTCSDPNYESILRTVHTWPAAKRFLLIQDLLKTIAPAEQPNTPAATLSQALGLLATNQPVPSNEETARWLAEYRAEKYG